MDSKRVLVHMSHPERRGLRLLLDSEATFDFSTSEAMLNLLELEAADTARTITLTQEYHYSRWYRFVIAVLRLAYGWLGYKAPPKEYRTILPNMRITKVEQDERGLHIEASTKGAVTDDNQG